MGKVRIRARTKKEAWMRSRNGGVTGSNDVSLKNTVGKLESDIKAISLGPPRSKILKKTATASPSSSNFASRINKEKKKVRFCQNLVAEELQEQKTSTSENAKHYFKVIHPSAIEKRIRASGGAKGQEAPAKTTNFIDAIIPAPDVLLNASARALRKLIRSSTKDKRTILKAKKRSFKKKMELLKAKNEELEKTKQRQQTVIVGDMQPILQALPDVEDDVGLETELVSKQEEKPNVVPNKPKYSMKKTQQAILDSLNFFEASGVTVGMGVSKT